MDEAEWLTSKDPRAMLSLFFTGRRKASARRLRLFACACVRRVLGLLCDERCRWTVMVAESYADGGTNQDHLIACYQQDHDQLAMMGLASRDARLAVEAVAFTIVRYAAFQAIQHAAWAAAATVGPTHSPAWGIEWESARAVQSALLRDIVGNPFRPAALDPAWRTPAVLSLARVAYRERLDDGRLDPVRLTILADALEEAGASPGVLADLHSPGPHYRGCRVLDLALGGRYAR